MKAGWYKREFFSRREGGSNWKEVEFIDAETGKRFYHFKRLGDHAGMSVDRLIKRQEFFGESKKPQRVFSGWQNCFVEFVDEVDKLGKFPDKDETEKIRKNLGFDDSLMKMYMGYYNKYCTVKQKGG